MGDVWMARNEATQAELAVKTLQRSERSPLHDERFRREARLSATISHRNVVRVFDLVDESDGTLGLVMELLRGSTLEDCMRDRGPMPSRQAVAVAVPVLSAMHHVHQKGIVHRDMKPGNVFFAVEPDGHVIPKVLDFGIAKLPAAGSALTIDGSVLGTPHYMSPEQIRGQEDLDGRTDMFSLAVVIYEMLTGVRVFQRETASASLAAVLEHEVDPDPRIEPRLWIAISRALAKRPYERFASCAEFLTALRSAIDATDDDLAQALQEIRPRLDASTNTVPSIALSGEIPRVQTTRPWSMIVGGTIGIGVAALVVSLLLGGKPQPVVGAPSEADSSGPEAVESRVVPAPAPSPSPSPTTASPVSESRLEIVDPPARAAGSVGRPPPRRAPASSAERKKKQAAGGVATTPGF
jgi:serine/threonine-protein kinase